ncbi:uncharacterized protein LOC141656632 [Silene latifolia]|uniref:uncharacterized protein LOC141656632 n=1 Tax=Silene latifolia TaxID=37657 RepID=UPI003D776495
MASVEHATLQNGIKLAVNIIATDFGNPNAKVCECLLRRGFLTKPQISKFTELPPDKVKNCLQVLIQHNCVQAFALEQEGGGRDTTVVVTQYMALIDNIIQRLRFAKFITVVSKELDKEAREILEGLLQHGRLTLPQILDKAMEDAGSDANRDAYNESFCKLVRSRFVERFPAPEPFIPLPTDEENSKQSRPKARKFFVKEVTLEERALAAAIPMDAERFSLLDEHDGDSDEDKNGGNVSGSKVGEKRKRDSVELANELDLLKAKGEPLWRVNFEEFINRLRKKACVEYARATYDNTAAVILESILKGTKSTENTVSLSLDSIFEEVVKNEGPAMTLELVRCSLEQLHFCSEDDDDGYSINLKDIIDKARLEEVESLVLKRYGHDAFRIFRSLSTGRALDTDQVSEKTLTDKKDTPKILYRLWQDGFLQMEKISITTGQKQTNILSWSVKMDKIWRKVLDELHHAALNLSLRCTHELEKDREISNMSKSADKMMSKELESRLRRKRKVYFALSSSLMELDDAIMLFSNFPV